MPMYLSIYRHAIQGYRPHLAYIALRKSCAVCIKKKVGWRYSQKGRRGEKKEPHKTEKKENNNHTSLDSVIGHLNLIKIIDRDIWLPEKKRLKQVGG